MKILEETYQERIFRFSEENRKLRKQSDRIAAGRLVLFIVMIISLVGVFKGWFFEGDWRAAGLVIPMIFLGGFLYLVKKAAILGRDIRFRELLIRINEDELKAIAHDHSPFDPGEQYISYDHPYTYDLDIFGKHSIYRLVNRAGTPLGKDRLAGLLSDPGTGSAEILGRQEAVREQAGKIDWRQKFLATARESDWDEKHGEAITTWFEGRDRFSRLPFYKLAVLLNPLISVILVLLVSFDILQVAALIWFLVPTVIVLASTRHVMREQNKADRLIETFRKYQGLVEMIENEEFTSKYLKEKKVGLTHSGIPASQVMKQLTRILWGLEIRGNTIMAFFLNVFFLWDILMMRRLEHWRREYRNAFGSWTGIIADIEVINSLSTLACNRPEFIYPVIKEGPFRLKLIDGGHPLIHPERRVDNSLSFDGPGNIYLITGPNMAGKSTLLRMTGVNMILGMAGAPVCAGQMEMVPTAISTSVRTNDSLGDDESYFYAELKKLNRIISHLESGKQLFVIIDEMLRGTNSADKHAGSAAVIRRLIAMEACGLVATHDVDLGGLRDEYPGRLLTFCFEAETKDDVFVYDYRLREGVSRSLNATFLMQKMGIIEGKRQKAESLPRT